jgi:hypothetical protein
MMEQTKKGRSLFGRAPIGSFYFFFRRAPCGLLSGGTMNKCVFAIAAADAVGFCSTKTPLETWPPSNSMNGNVVPSAV